MLVPLPPSKAKKPKLTPRKARKHTAKMAKGAGLATMLGDYMKGHPY